MIETLVLVAAPIAMGYLLIKYHRWYIKRERDPLEERVSLYGKGRDDGN